MRQDCEGRQRGGWRDRQIEIGTDKQTLRQSQRESDRHILYLERARRRGRDREREQRGRDGHRETDTERQIERHAMTDLDRTAWW